MSKRFFISEAINGNIRFWNVERLDNNHTTIEYGYWFSPNTEVKVTKETQANYLKRIKDKIKDGYVEVNNSIIGFDEAKKIIKESASGRAFKEPMKFQKYPPNQFVYPCWGQPKLNGLRCYIVWGKWTYGTGMFEEVKEGAIALSSDGNRYHMPFITDVFVKEDFCINGEGQPVLYFDGEFYVHGEKLNTIRKRVPMEVNGKVQQNSLPSDPVKFYCFDMAIEDTGFKDRIAIRDNRLETIMQRNIVIRKVPVTIINDYKHAEQFTDDWIAEGFEGAVFREIDSVYEYGRRSSHGIKVKRYTDGEFIVTDIIPKDKSRGCKFVCRNDINDAEFESMPEGTFDEQEEWLANKENIIGEKVTIKFYERSGVKNCPNHSNVITVRDYE